MAQRAGNTTELSSHTGEEIDPKVIRRILEEHADERAGLIAVLESIQAEVGCLPESTLRAVAEQTGRSLVDVYGIATFYRAFSLQPRGRHLVTVCLGTACHVRGAPMVVEEFERQLGIRAGETTGDREFTLETVNCLGACALGPVAVIDGRYFSKMKKANVSHLLEEALADFKKTDADQEKRVFPLAVSCPRCNHSLMDNSFVLEGYPSVRITMSFGSTHGWLRLCSLYGCHTIAAEYDIPPGMVTDFFCPHCHEQMTDSGECLSCAAPMVPMMVRGGGVVQICSRRGCRAQMLHLV